MHWPVRQISVHPFNKDNNIKCIDCSAQAQVIQRQNQVGDDPTSQLQAAVLFPSLCTELQYVEEGCGTDFVRPLPLSEKILFYVKTLNQT